MVQRSVDSVSIYIDGSNLYHSIRANFNRTDLDILKFRDKLVGSRHLVRTYYYDAPFPQDKDKNRSIAQQRFHQILRRQPYLELRLGRLVFNNWPTVAPQEKGVDVKIATDMLTHGFRDNYNIALLVSGDTDLVDALQALKDYGKHTEVALFGGGWTSQALRDVADRVIDIDAAFLSDCWRGS